MVLKESKQRPRSNPSIAYAFLVFLVCFNIAVWGMAGKMVSEQGFDVAARQISVNIDDGFAAIDSGARKVVQSVTINEDARASLADFFGSMGTTVKRWLGFSDPVPAVTEDTGEEEPLVVETQIFKEGKDVYLGKNQIKEMINNFGSYGVFMPTPVMMELLVVLEESFAVSAAMTTEAMVANIAATVITAAEIKNNDSASIPPESVEMVGGGSATTTAP